jgi:hypothetical protein
LSQKPWQGGFAWVFLQYILGFKRLGWEVLFVDRLDPDMCVNAQGERCPVERSENSRYASAIIDGFGLGQSSSLIYERRALIGLPREEVVDRASDSALLLNIMGFLDDEEILAAVPRRVFLDIDPGFPQMWHDLKLADVFAGHTDFVTIGENIGRPECHIPTCGLEWVTIPQPVVLDQWPHLPPTSGPFTTVASWRGAYGPIEYRGRQYGLRAHEFRRFVKLPRLTSRPFEVALDIHTDETKDLDLLKENGWVLRDPKQVARDPWSYRSYIQGSGAEFGVAKNMYVQANSGWLSDRSLCYLASGGPVLCQDTGFGERYRSGEGLLAFGTLEEAVAGVEAIDSDPERHGRAARRIAEEFFDSDKVLTVLLERLGVN